MVRERVTWFSLGAATAGVIAVLALRHPGDEPPRGIAHQLHDDNTVDGTRVVVPVPARAALPPAHVPVPAPPRADSPALPPALVSQPLVEPAAESAISPEQPLRTGRQIVSHAIEMGRWSNNDAAALAAISNELSEEDRRDLYSTLIVAINQDRVRVEGGLMPR